MKKFLASRGVGGASGWGAPLAVAPGAALPWWRKHCPPPPIDNAQLIASSGAVPTSEPTSRPALRRVRRGFGPSNSPGDGDSSTASITLAFAPASRAASMVRLSARRRAVRTAEQRRGARGPKVRPCPARLRQVVRTTSPSTSCRTAAPSGDEPPAGAGGKFASGAARDRTATHYR
jgi:hypothetical protein